MHTFDCTDTQGQQTLRVLDYATPMQPSQHLNIVTGHWALGIVYKLKTIGGYTDFLTVCNDEGDVDHTWTKARCQESQQKPEIKLIYTLTAAAAGC